MLTATMLYASIAPSAALQSTFGESLDGPLADLIVRNWGALIGLVGGMLIYGAFHPPARIDSAVVVLFGWYLLSTRSSATDPADSASGAVKAQYTASKVRSRIRKGVYASA